MTDTVNRVTKWWVNDLNRVVSTTVNFVDGIYSPDNADEDITTYYVYDAIGNLLSLTDVLGHETRMEYDALNRLERTIVNYKDGDFNPSLPDEDLITNYTYDEAGNVETITDPLGRVTTNVYDDLGRLETVIDPLSGTLTYAYDAHGNLLSIIDAASHTTSYGYDKRNRVVTTTNELGNDTYVEYNEIGLPITRTNENGHIMVSAYDSLYRLLAQTDEEGHTTNFAYDAAGRLISQTDAEGHLTIFVYNSLNRLITITNPISGTTVITYDVLGNRLAERNPNGDVATYQYDQLNRLITQTDANNLTTLSAYDGLGRVISTTNPANETTEFEYDQVGRLVLMRDPLQNEVVYRYDAVGNRVAIIDALAVETRYVYDDLNRLTTVIENYVDGIFNPGLTDEDIKTSYQYDGVGNLITMTNPLNNVTTYAYDGLNRLVTITDPLTHTIHYGYDAVGNRTVITNANQIAITYQFDKRSRLVNIDYPSPETDVTLGYDKVGNLITMTDSTGTTLYTFDDLYRLETVSNGNGQVITYTYDAVGNLINFTYPDGSTVTYSYDATNRLQSLTDWSQGQYQYSYDAANRLSQLARPGNITSTYQYNKSGQLIELNHSGIEGSLASYQYELNDQGYQHVVTETVLNPGGIITTSGFVPSNGLLVIEAEEGLVSPGNVGHNWISQTVQTGYTGTAYLRAMPDSGMRYESNEVADSPQLSFALYISTPITYTVWVRGMASDAASDSLHVGMDGQVAPQANRLTGFVANEWRWSRLTMSDTLATLPFTDSGSHTLNLWMREDGLRIDRLLLITDTTFIPTGVGPLAAAPQLITVTIPTAFTQVITYGYDHLSRLVTADYNNGNYFHYAYDVAGNRLSQTTPTGSNAYVYDAANRLAEVDGVAYTWDNNGNLLSDGQTTYTYDSANRLTALSRGSETHTYLYNGQGERVQQTVNGIMTEYLLDPRLQLTQVLGDGDNFYLYQPDGIRLGEVGLAGWQVHLPDALGSVRQLIQTNGEIVGNSSYEPFGATLMNFGQVSVFQFAGEARDASGLTFLRARYLKPIQGRFISQDPWLGDLGRPQSLNGWSYVENNPINLTDPSGLFPEYCRTSLTTVAYEHCVRTFYNLDPIDEPAPSRIEGTPGCYEGPIPYRAPGYIEGSSNTVSPGVGGTWGHEVAHDFATMEWQAFDYHGLAFGAGYGTMRYTGFIEHPSGKGFRSWQNIETDYSGFFNVVNAGIYVNGGANGGQGIGIVLQGSVGIIEFAGHPDSSIKGYAYYGNIGNGEPGKVWGAELGGSIIFYEPSGDVQPHYRLIDPNNPDGPKKVDLASTQRHKRLIY